MKKYLLLLVFATIVKQISAQTTITIMDSIIFHDGYASLVTNPPPPAGVIKHRNDLFARKLSSAEIQSIGTTLQMNVLIKALCDNYDRIGSVNMALVPPGSTTYVPDNVQRIELGRFITPFMNKNIQPDSVPYTFNIDNVAMFLKDTGVTNNFDIWIELAVFGVPYAAQTQVAGCTGRNDVFKGRLQFVTNAPAPDQNTNLLIPLYFNNNFNNYQTGATDTIGKTTKTITFNVPGNLTDAAFFLITSNHGANSGGEEYNRRIHFTYFDGIQKTTYKPGRLTCEPFRMYNTQANGIYGSTVLTPGQWQNFSNWCPGDVIDIRRINLGPVAAGSHSFMIRVPTAVFTGGQGNFPLSLYFQGKTAGLLTGLNDFIVEDHTFSIYPNPTNGQFTIDLPEENAEITVTDMLGKQILKKQAIQNTIILQLENNGVYIVYVRTKDGISAQKVIVNN
jgi:hypothetical protein